MNRRSSRKKRSTGLIVTLVIIIVVLIAAAVAIAKYGFGDPDDGKNAADSPTPSASAAPSPTEASTATPDASPSPTPTATPSPTPSPSATPSSTPDKSGASGDDGSMQVIAQPESITVLVNKSHMLPDDYEPADLVYPDVPFIFSEKIDKRKMRKVAADALEKLFAAADKDGNPLAGVSAYRSYATQKSLFNTYVKRDGLEKARTYSALPGTSEHETGLAIDVTGSDGKCAASDCFGDEPQAKWLAGHAAEYGFIIRYPKGMDDITGYQYEPWHIRYVGEDIAKVIADKDITLEEYYEQYGDPADGGKQVAVGQ